MRGWGGVSLINIHSKKTKKKAGTRKHKHIHTQPHAVPAICPSGQDVATRKKTSSESIINGRIVKQAAETIRCSIGHMWGWEVWVVVGGVGAVVWGVVLRGPDDIVGRRVGIGHAREHSVQAADVPVVVVALNGHGGRVWKTQRDKEAANQIQR